MKQLFDAARRLALAMHWVSGVLLIVMVGIVLLDILTRTLFSVTGGAVNVTFPGAIEIVSFSLLFMVLFALPYSVRRGQVIVDVFTEKMSEWAKGVLAAIYLFGLGLLGLGMAVRFFDSAARVAASGETSMNLFIPMTYVYAAAGFATAVLAIRGVLVAVEQIVRVGERH